MTAKMISVSVLAVFAAAGQDNRTVDLNGGLRAQVLSVGRDSSGFRPVVTAAVKITNTGKDYVFLMFYGTLSAIDDSGVKFDGDRGDAVAGVARCQTVPPERCIGIPDGSSAFPLRSYTTIDPGRSVTVHFKLMTPTPVSKGEHVSLAAEMGYRLVKEADLAKDADLSDAQKIKQVRSGNMSFEPLPVSEK
jgi:hypothetical protein